MRQLSLLAGKRQRGRAARPAKEINLHFMVADVLRRWRSPGWRCTHFPAGEYRHPATAARLKRMGLEPGWPDFILLAPQGGTGSILNPLFGGAHFLELKREGQDLTDYQQSFADYCDANGYAYFWTADFSEAVDQLKTWGAVIASVSA